MAKDPLKLDRLSNSLRNVVEGIGGEPDFIDFLLGWYGLLNCESTELPTWPYWSTAAQRKKKRELEAQYGDLWRVEWKKLQAEAKCYKRETKFYTNLFALEPQTKKVGHRPMKSNFWFAMSDTKNYFCRVSGKPNWNLLAKIFYETGGEVFGYQYAQAEYAKRKGYLGRYDGEIRLDKLIRTYGTFKPVIMEVLKSRTPMWAPPHREKAQKILNKLGIEEVLGTTSVLNSSRHTKKSNSNDRTPNRIRRKRRRP